MVAGKVKVAMGLQKSPANCHKKPETPPKTPSPSPSPSSGKITQKTVFSRSFGVYFPRSSAQVQPRPPDVGELIRLVEQLRDRESRLKTELLEHKLLKESVSIVPVLESQIAIKDAKFEKASIKIEGLELENRRLSEEVEELKIKIEEERKINIERIKSMEGEMAELRKMAAERSRVQMILENEDLSASQRFQGLIEVTVRSNLIKNLRRVTKSTDIIVNQENSTKSDVIPETVKRDEEESERQRHSRCDSEELAETALSTLRSRPPRVPKPPPKPSSSSSSSSSSSASTEQMMPPPPPPPPAPLKKVPPPPPPPLPKKSAPAAPQPPIKSAPPPPPPLPKGTRAVSAKVRRVPEVVEFYHSLMRRDSRRDSSSGVGDIPANNNARDMIGEIENRSSYLLAIKTDVETQGDFIRFLIREVENASFTDIEDVVPFVKWLDDELSFLVDERAVLKHFDWPEQKADALREAAFGYCDLKKLESEASSFRDNARQPCIPALKKMQALLEKLEHGVYNLSRMRESATNRYRGFQIPMEWMLDSGIVSQMKLASVKLAMMYMKRVSAELETVSGSPEEEELIIRGVRFAFRVHQFAGGFDVETMRAFQELRDKARSCHIQSQNHHQQKLLCSSASASSSCSTGPGGKTPPRSQLGFPGLFVDNVKRSAFLLRKENGISY